jgi:S-methylmethionine-dependent homocysteine/selenocysteine methylase
MNTDWRRKLARKEVVIIDGAMGSELARRGMPKNATAWSGLAALTHGALLREIHEEYAAAGADVLIANTFATARFVLEAAGHGADLARANRRAIALAQHAAATRRLAVAGSISNFPPAFDRERYPEPDVELAAYREQSAFFEDAGADVIALEMMEELEHAARAFAAARETALPIWLGVSCRTSADGRIVAFDYPKLELSAVLDTLLVHTPDVVNIMHSELAAIPRALELVRERFAGPIGVYPEIGPDVTPDELVRHAEYWVRAGARLVGGCCGSRPAHIAALAQRFAQSSS